MGAADTLRQLIDAGKSSKRLDELSSARVIGKVALQIHAAQQKAGAGKAVGPITPMAITFGPNGDVKFTPAETASLGYSAPEQLTGSGDRRSDVFSLGTVLWELLTYQRLFDAMNDAAVKMAVTDREITPPSEINANVPAELSAICMRALARNPADRYQSLKSMAVELEEFLSEAGYENNDEKIAQYLRQMPKTLKIEPPSITRSPGGTQPPPAADRLPGLPQPPSIQTAPPVDAVSSAAPLAGASGASPPSLSSASPSATAVGVPAAPAAPLVPMAPILPNQGRLDKSTILTPVPPPVKVATNAAVVEATHAESKPAAQTVEQPQAKPEAPPVVTPTATPEAPKADAKKPGALTMGWDAVAEPQAEAEKPVEPKIEAAKPVEPKVEAAKPVEPKVAAAKPAEPKVAAAKLVEPKVAAAKPVEPKPAQPVGAAAAKVERPTPGAPKVEAKAQPEATPVEVKSQTAARPDDSAAKRNKKPTGEQKKKSTGEQKRRTGPNPVAAVSLGPGPRDSKADVLAGWGWGTDKHNAIAPDDYAGDDEDFHAPPDSKKTLIYVIGGGVAFAALVTVIALLAGGGSKDKKKPNKPVVTARTSEARDAVAAPTPTPTDTNPPAAGSAIDPQGSAMAAGSALDPAAQKAAEDQAAADKAAADKAAAEQAAADKVTADKAAADKAAADKAAAEQAAADKKAQELADQKAAADKAATDKAAAQALADKKAADKAAADKAAADEKARLLADKKAAEKAAADQKAKELAEKRAADKAAADKAAAEKAAQAKIAAKTAPKTTRPTTSTPKATTTVAKADTKVDVESAYRQGLQQYARGDTAGALASLRTSLAANPNYAPTWRGLGLVFEKMGEKEQARAAYKRYLQLAPGATDTEMIKGRLEKLGT